MHPWHDLKPGRNIPDVINVVVEIPKGSRNKYELDKETGVYELSRVLYSPMIYPGDYGFIPRTYYEDGDPLDAIVLINEPTFTGCLIEARPVAIFKMLDRGAPDDKILCVPAHNPFFNHITDMKQVPPHFLKEVAHFFAVYKDLEGARTLPMGWEGAEEAQKQVHHGVKLYEESKRDLPGWTGSDTAQREILVRELDVDLGKKKTARPRAAASGREKAASKSKAPAKATKAARAPEKSRGSNAGRKKNKR